MSTIVPVFPHAKAVIKCKWPINRPILTESTEQGMQTKLYIGQHDLPCPTMSGQSY